MYYVADKQIAERALAELRAARGADRASALSCLQRQRNEVAGARQDDRPRLEAWIAIRRLYDAFRVAPGTDLKLLWQDAIAKTIAWGASLH